MDKQDEINAKLLTLIESQRELNNTLMYVRNDLRVIKNILILMFAFFLFGLFLTLNAFSNI